MRVEIAGDHSKLWLSAGIFRLQREWPPANRLIWLISIADTDWPFLWEHDEVVICEDAKNWVEFEL